MSTREKMARLRMGSWFLLACVVEAGPQAIAAVSVIGVQYQQDNPYTEFQCIWHDRNYPTDCGGVVGGSNVHVYLRNDGTSSASVSDVTLAGYSLKTVIKTSTNSSYNGASSIYFYWDNPPQSIIDAGEPVWYRADPVTIPAGGVGQVVVRLRYVPKTKPVNLGVRTSAGDVSASIPVDANAPQLASVGFSQDRQKVYLHWRRSGGGAPTTIKMDDLDVTANTVTVGDPLMTFAESVITLSSAISNGSYHVYQGIYSDGTTATGSVRTWAHDFIHATWYTFPIDDGDTNACKAWIDDCTNRGINAVENQMPGALSHFLDSGEGEAYAAARGFGGIAWNEVGWDPIAWFLDDEPDAEEDTFDCGTGLNLPCGSGHDTGVLVMKNVAIGEQLRKSNPGIPTTVNMDATLKPDNYYSYGQATDYLQADPYYQARLDDTYHRNQERIPLYENPRDYIYAISSAIRTAAEPNQSHIILYSCKQTTWPYPTREAKRLEFYYALAGGAKGISYWWFKLPNGLGSQHPDAMDMWYEVGLLGNEAKTISPLLVTSHPVAMPLTATSNVFVKALAAGPDTMILIVVNDGTRHDTTGCHYTQISNATVTATLPTWMQASPTAFEVKPSGLSSVSSSLNNGQLQLALGTLNLTKMIVITTNPTLRATIQQRYEENVWPGICAFASGYCLPQTNPPSIVQDPMSQTADQGGSSTFTVGVSGSSPLSYQWKKNNTNLTDGGHYSGTTTAVLTISLADSNDAASYTCVVTNPYGTATSNAATLTVAPPRQPSITQQPTNQLVVPGGTASFAVAANGTPPLSYQWQKNQVNLTELGHYSGVTTATLTVSSADSNDTASYRCVVTNSYGSATTNAASLTVTSCSPPSLLNAGFDGGNTGGVAANWTGYTRAEVPTTVVYTIQTASPAQGLAYQQIQTSYVASGGAGVYQVVSGCVNGATYQIQGSYRTNSANGRATVRCSPNGGTTYSSATDLSPAATTTSSTWSTFSGTVTATAPTMTLFLDCQTHVSGSTAKAAAFDGLTITMLGCTPTVAPTITQQPSAQSVCPGSTATFGITATGTAPLAYQWQKNSVNLSNGGHYSGATMTTLTISSADSTDTTNYLCVVTNAGGSATSNQAALSLKGSTTITGQPSDQTVAPGGTASFSITATGSGTLSYQWQKNGVDIVNGGHYSGATTATLTISTADLSDAASYECVVTGDCGSLTSGQADLIIDVPTVPGDFDNDGDVDSTDFGFFAGCITGPEAAQTSPSCAKARMDVDEDVDQSDFGLFQRCYSGEDTPTDPNCAN